MTATATRAPARSLAPDLARGVMLLAIACAHAPLFITAVDRGPAAANAAALVLHEVLVGNHARPLFAFLFGYALVQMLDRRTDGGADPAQVRRMLRRRGGWLVAFGAVHTLFVPIDILAVYGAVSVLLVGLLRARRRTLLWTGCALLVPATLSVGLGMWQAMSQGVWTFETGAVPPAPDGLAELAGRMRTWAFSLLFGGVAVAPPMVFGMWAARSRLLDEPGEHRPFLVRAVVATQAVSVAGALPAILVHLGMWADPAPGLLWTAALLQPLTGYFGGMGLAAAIALAAIAAARSDGPLTNALRALGQRSMTFYLFQTAAFLLAFRAYGLGLQDSVGLAGALVVAAAVWLASLFAADLMRRAGRRGPAEVLLRRLAYR
ncbi:DUF418 domain-containing protein [Nocardiopsis sp. RSe5-2]|uniref:DUF418 domain-containing protein n=1 Tax=Nocardiopsis endophytica TaxID=3018445 RepID=A0ABT4UC40_9ACTN|nr:DUF418 domain-containing protein [Nocardiopsis endophytica]MDA2814531.1 DUF418 domain-containing protein [Nocardiopsis endophytica]